MSWRLVAASLIASGVLTAQVSASSAVRPQQHWKRHVPPVGPVAEHDYFPRPNPDYVGWSYIHHSPGRWVYFGPSYTFVPGRGIVDEACNLPTSACPNSQRANY